MSNIPRLSSSIRNQAETTERNLRMYSVAAVSASVAALALTPHLEGKVVITHANIPITLDQSVTLSLTNNGTSDVRFLMYGVGPSSQTWIGVGAVPGGGIMVEKTNFFASALMRGAKIGPSAHFGTFGSGQYFRMEVISCLSGACHSKGKWGGDHPNRFVGVKFPIHGQTHYGWVRVTIDTTTSPPSMTGTITEYGYETIANKALDAGLSGSAIGALETSAERLNIGPSLGMLALGADGLAIWKRED